MSRPRKQPILPPPALPPAKLGNESLNCLCCEHIKRLAIQRHDEDDIATLWETMQRVSYGPSIRCERCDEAKRLMEPIVRAVPADDPVYFSRDDVFYERMHEVHKTVDPSDFDGTGTPRNY